MFLCCHPALAMEARVALTLRLLGGLTVPEIARAFLVGEDAMARRLTCAKAKIAAARIPYRVPQAHDLPGRVDGVRPCPHLVFNEGYLATGRGRPGPPRPHGRGDPARTPGRGALPEDGEAAGLLALMLLTEARGGARVSAAGELVRPDEDRARGPRAHRRGIALVRERLAVVARGAAAPGRYQILAAITAVHVLGARGATGRRRRPLRPAGRDRPTRSSP